MQARLQGKPDPKFFTLSEWSDCAARTALRQVPALMEVQWPDTPFPLEESLVLVTRRGSEAHGTYIPGSNPTGIDDRDLYGLVIPPAPYYLGLQKWEHVEAITGCWDVVLDEFRKFVGLLCAQNPNVLSILWAEPEDHLLMATAGQRLVKARHLFRHRHYAYNSFVGYAQGQLKRMTSFGEFRGYMGEKRKALVERYGFDTKNAAHLLRILHMGVEYLEQGELHVRRTWDRELLLAVKRGEVPLAEVQRLADAAFKQVHTVYERSPLPESIDMDAVNQLVVGCVQARLA